MILNMNPITFKNFGTVLSQDSENNKPQNLVETVERLNTQNSNTMKSYIESAVILKVTDGIGLLCITDDLSKANISVFLLDKPILIKPQQFYQVIPLTASCQLHSYIEPFGKVVKHEKSLDLLKLIIHPKLSIDNVHTLFYQEKELNFSFKGESHDFWELTYVDHGELQTIVEEESFSLKQGQLMLYAPNQYHTQYSHSDIPVCFLTITFDMSLDQVDAFSNRVFDINTATKDIFKKILEEYEQDNFYRDDLILCYLKELIIKLLRSSKLKHPMNHLNTDVQINVENTLVNTTLDYIHNNIDQKMSIPEIARAIPISPSYLSKIFKKHMHLTIIEYVNNYRLEKGKELIRTSNENFTQIAQQLGYNSVHYFSKQFKNKYGVSPSYYSKSLK